MITKEDLLNFLTYDKEKGKLFWLNPPKNNYHLKGKEAGCIYSNKCGLKYRALRINNKFYHTHSLIFFIEKNIYPELVDHIDGNTLNNVIENLRSVTNRKNCSNSYRHRAGKLVGSSWIKSKQCWMSHIQLNGKTKNLGYFSTEKEAHDRYILELKNRGLL